MAAAAPERHQTRHGQSTLTIWDAIVQRIHADRRASSRLSPSRSVHPHPREVVLRPAARHRIDNEHRRSGASYQAVVEYIDNFAPVRARRNTDVPRATRLLATDQPARLKRTAWAALAPTQG